MTRKSPAYPFGRKEGLALEFKRATDRLPSSFFETICKFMLQMGQYEELGSGVRRVNQYLPHYAPGAGGPVFEDGEMFSVTVPLGAEAQVTGEVTPHVTPHVTPQVGTKLGLSRDQVEILQKCLIPSPIGDLMAISGRTNRSKFRDQVLQPLMEENLLAMTVPHKRTSSKQKYRLTGKGRDVLKHRQGNTK